MKGRADGGSVRGRDRCFTNAKTPGAEIGQPTCGELGTDAVHSPEVYFKRVRGTTRRNFRIAKKMKGPIRNRRERKYSWQTIL